MESFGFDMMSLLIYSGDELNNESKVVSEIIKIVMARNRKYFDSMQLFLPPILSRKTKLINVYKYKCIQYVYSYQIYKYTEYIKAKLYIRL